MADSSDVVSVYLRWLEENTAASAQGEWTVVTVPFLRYGDGDPGRAGILQNGVSGTLPGHSPAQPLQGANESVPLQIMEPGHAVPLAASPPPLAARYSAAASASRVSASSRFLPWVTHPGSVVHRPIHQLESRSR